MATIKDVAVKAGVSTTTVSYVLTGKRYVSEPLTRKVRKALQDLGYSPNNLARSLRSGKTDTIGLIIPDSSNAFFAEISRRIEDIGFKKGYSVFLCNSDDDPQKQQVYLQSLIAKQVDGLIFISACHDPELFEQIKSAGIPFVILDRHENGPTTNAVITDNVYGAEAATQYLASLGHKKIACIAGPQNVVSSNERIRGYKEGLSAAGLEFNPDYLLHGDFRFHSGFMAMQNLMKLTSPPTAVFVCNDMMAVGAIRLVHLANQRVPEDFSIIGFDNSQIAEVVTPALTTIAQPIDQIAQSAMDLLFEQITHSSEKAAEIRILQPKLVIRGTCQKIPGGD
ncbi:MAG: LacI family DNA-binding transcriptional regulator [Anaerolineaceae bacterium]|nr:LacI family DNA-binding transcriptional regulator [Anaerolineaceae bacterium]